MVCLACVEVSEVLCSINCLRSSSGYLDDDLVLYESFDE